MCVCGALPRAVTLSVLLAPPPPLAVLPMDIYDFKLLNEISFLIKTLFSGLC